MNTHMRRLLLLCVAATLVCGAWITPDVMRASPCYEGCFTDKEFCEDARTYIAYADEVAKNGEDPLANSELVPDTKKNISKWKYKNCTKCDCVDVHCDYLCEGVREDGDYEDCGVVIVETECLTGGS